MHADREQQSVFLSRQQHHEPHSLPFPHLLVGILVLKQQPYGGRLINHQLSKALIKVPVELACITVAQELASGGQHAAVVIHLQSGHMN